MSVDLTTVTDEEIDRAILASSQDHVWRARYPKGTPGERERARYAIALGKKIGTYRPEGWPAKKKYEAGDV